MNRFGKIIIFTVLIAFSILVGWEIKTYTTENLPDSDILFQKTPERLLDKYTINNLSKTQFADGKFSINKSIYEEDKFESFLFEFEFDTDLDGKLDKFTTGIINIPKKTANPPVLFMFRGYVDQESYISGMDTKNSSYVFSRNGFITIAPDFLGYAGSSENNSDIFTSRFQTYVTATSLISSFEHTKTNPNIITASSPLTKILSNYSSINIWGHSNGGQIAITTLEILEKNYKTSLWAPVTKPFPYSVLYYTDESDDRGKLIRSELSKFENLYDPDLYSLDLYIANINAPLLIHQGSMDNSVPKRWSDSFVKLLVKFDIDHTYHVYPGADHNMRPVWDIVVNRDIEFFKI